MREMKDSGVEWIGAMPRAWKMNTIAQIFLQVKCKNTGLQEKNLLSLSYGKVKRKSIDTVEGLLPESFDGYNIIEKDDIVLRLTNLQNDHTSLRVGLAEERGIITSAYLTIRNRSNFCPKYLYYYLHSFDIAKGFYGMGAGVRQGLNWDGVKWLKILAPSVPEQERIAAFLDAECAEIDAVLEKTRASIEEYKKLKQAVITQAVTKGIRGDRPMKNSGIEWIGDIPAEWEIRKIFRAINKVGDIDHYMPDSVDDGIPYLMTGNLQEKLSDVNLKHCKKVSFQDYEMLSSKIRVSKGDVIFARYATIGTVCFVDTEDNILVSYACLIIKPNSSLLYGEFLFYYLKSTAFLEEIKQYIKANTQANVGLDSVSKAKIALPSVHEQQKIVEYLRDKCKKIDALIAKKQQYLTEIENYKKSLIYEYVTGKKEVHPL